MSHRPTKRATTTSHRVGSLFPVTFLTYLSFIVACKRLSSSIHAIYRPLARSRRLSVKGPFSGKQRTSSPVAEEEATSEDASISEDELEPDLEEDTPRPRHARPHHVRHQSLSQERDYPLSRPRPDRSGSLLTLKGHRKERLAEKLREIFELDGIHEVWAGTFTSTSLVNPLANTNPAPT